MFVSDCCGVEMGIIEAQYGICSCCGEHCSLVDDNGELFELDYDLWTDERG